MLTYIQNKFKNHISIPFLGEDNKYHTVYFIEFESGHYYIGKHSTENYIDDYFASGRLPILHKKNGALYNRHVLYFFSTAAEALECETNILQIPKIFENSFCLNVSQNYIPDLSGTIVVSKGNTFKMINPLLLESYLQDGWKQQGIRRIYITNGTDNKKILEDDLDKFIQDGWILGNSAAKDCIFIKKGNDKKFIKKQFLQKYIDDGWEYFHNQKDYKVIKKNGQLKKVHKTVVDDFINDGWEYSSTVKDLIYIRKNDQFKRVKGDEVDDYLLNGWSLGNVTTGQIYITLNDIEKRINV